uniref:Uncharacterized protein n=1 Tax=Anguilla anguilla TaxID=7936 RepID=A0A0E9VBL5_ANGAN
MSDSKYCNFNFVVEKSCAFHNI